ncbi:hypothetical protein RF11_09775 [Thelohanellus kitauei]|uniref:Uncharacterized protein n=1 Tax=Thelohanellus kitauei TaxID=669202 RepID=A0A0C2J6M6_THEKT|nr:hypothetical protein RF11_09775 [Thelohanellus kitauei]
MSGRMQGALLENKEEDAWIDDLAILLLPVHVVCNYFVAMNHIHGNLFLTIVENNDSAQKNRMVVPMNCLEEFLGNLDEIKIFVPNYRSKIPANNLIRRKRLAFTATMKTTTGMVYYFEVLDNNGYFRLQIRYIYKGRMDFIYLNIFFLDQLVETIEELHRKYSSLTCMDDIFLDRSGEIDKRTDIYSLESGVNNTVIGNNHFTPSYSQSIWSTQLLTKLPESVERKNTHVLNNNSDPSRSLNLYNLEKDKFDIFTGDDAFKTSTMEIWRITTSTRDVAKDYAEEFHDGSTGMNPGLQHGVKSQERN